MLLIICQTFTNLRLIDFVFLPLANVYQSLYNQPHPFHQIAQIAAKMTNYSKLLYQSFNNHFQSGTVPYINRVLVITNKLPIHQHQS